MEGRPGDRNRVSCAPRTSAPRCFSCPPPLTPRSPGSFTNTQRMLQWHAQAVEPGRRRSQRAVVHLPSRAADPGQAGGVRRRGRPARARPDLGLPGARAGSDDPDADAVLAEINGWDAGGRPLSSYTQLTADGSTACGCWIYCGVHADGVNQAARRKPRTASRAGWQPEWGWAWPANRRVLYNRASADPEGRPWSERKALVWWDAGAADDGPVMMCRTSSPTGPRPTDRPQRRPGYGGDFGHRPVHHAGGRQGVAVRSRRAG